MNVVAILETMWDWRGKTSVASFGNAPRFFRINPKNYSGKRLYRLCGSNANLFVTNACRQLGTSATSHGTPDPKWLAENLGLIETESVLGGPVDIWLVCGKVAQRTFSASGYEVRSGRVMEIPHPAARAAWPMAVIEETAHAIHRQVAGKFCQCEGGS